MTLPKLRVEDGMIIGRQNGMLWRSHRRHLIARLRCLLVGHDFSSWWTDDYEGPGEVLDPDEPDSFMPYCSRPSRPDEYGHRSCRNRCGTMEQRWPEREAPRLWREAVRSCA